MGKQPFTKVVYPFFAPKIARILLLVSPKKSIFVLLKFSFAMCVIRYQFATDETDALVDIDSVSVEDRARHTYRCLGCGQELVAKLGAVKAHHFAHKTAMDACNGESYLHKLGKRFLKQRFDSEGEFPIEIDHPISCSDQEGCPFFRAEECRDVGYRTFDLKKFYDTAAIEAPCGKFIADVLLTDSHHRYPPVLLEVLVAHRCTDEKYASGYRIVEIPIGSDQQLKDCYSHKLSARHGVAFWNFKKPAEKVRMNKGRVQRFHLMPSGRAYVSPLEEPSSCNPVRENSQSVLEVLFDGGYRALYPYNLGYYVAMREGILPKNCYLCKYHAEGFYEPMICRLYKKFSTPHTPPAAFAMECAYYRVDPEEVATEERELSEAAVRIIR